MRSFRDMNPITVFLCLISAAGVVMFCMDPIILLLSLAGAAALWFSICGSAGARECRWYLLLFLVFTAVNPLFNHNGMTVLFVLNDLPITLEAVYYGAAMGAMIVAVLWWFRSFAKIMTSDKLLYVFGSVSPKLALILSMTLRYIPLFRRQAQKTNQAQKALGLYKEDNAPDAIRGGVRVFSVMVTWALENGVVTADSMTARGYGVGRRSHFAIFKFRSSDLAVILCAAAFCAMTIWGIGSDAVGYTWYPALRAPSPSPLGTAAYICYGLLALLPAALEGMEAMKWKYLRSVI